MGWSHRLLREGISRVIVCTNPLTDLLGPMPPKAWSPSLAGSKLLGSVPACLASAYP